MWFGNLVTMKWWNDLWLNESFATYMSFVAMQSIPEIQYFDTYWSTFQQYKIWGINYDTRDTTHPICCQINSSKEAQEAFDGISYGKGASFLKQVHRLIGFENLQKAIRRYIELFQYKNTELSDFVDCL